MAVVLEELRDSEVEEWGFGARELLGEQAETLLGNRVVSVCVGGEGWSELLGSGLGCRGFSAKDETGREVERRGKFCNLA